jgi:hypothetical protein
MTAFILCKNGQPLGAFDDVVVATKEAFLMDTQDDAGQYTVLELPTNGVLDEEFIKNVYDARAMQVQYPDVYDQGLDLKKKRTEDAVKDWHEHLLILKKEFIENKLVELNEQVEWFHAHPEKVEDTLKRQKVLGDIVKYFDKYPTDEYLSKESATLYMTIKSDALIFSSKRF